MTEWGRLWLLLSADAATLACAQPRRKNWPSFGSPSHFLVVEALAECVLHRLAWRDEVLVAPMPGGPGLHGVRGKFCPAVGIGHSRIAALGDDGRQFPSRPPLRDQGAWNRRKALRGHVVDEVEAAAALAGPVKPDSNSTWNQTRLQVISSPNIADCRLGYDSSADHWIRLGEIANNRFSVYTRIILTSATAFPTHLSRSVAFCRVSKSDASTCCGFPALT